MSGIHVNAYSKLLQKLGIKESLKLYDKYQQLAYVSENVSERFGIDTIPVIFNDLEDYVENNDEDIFVDAWGIKRKKPKGGYYYDVVSYPLRGASLDKLKGIDFLKMLEEVNFDDLEERKENFVNSDKAVIGQIWPGSLFQCAQFLRGYDDFLIDLVADKIFAETLLDKLLEYNIAFADKYLDIFGDFIDVIKIADDMGTQDSLIISLKLYRETIKDKHKKLIEFIKSKTDAKVLFHSDGTIYDCIHDFIEIGVNIIQPVQVSAMGMGNTKKLKREFGKDVVFWGGGCDSQNILPADNCEKVVEEVKRRIDDLAPGGGFIFGPIHNIQPEVKPENIIAMFDSAIQYGNYGN